MLTFNQITNVYDPLFSRLYNLYALAFPFNERRSWSGLEFELSYEKQFCACALMSDDKFVGFLNYWLFDQFLFIEHLAVLPAMRGQKIGSEAVELFKMKTQLPIVFEVELPLDDDAVRRIKFYENHGFSVLSQKYAQPPYEADGSFVPMQLLCNDIQFADTHFKLIKETLYNKVYHLEQS